MDLNENIIRWRADTRVGQTLRDKWRLERLLGVGGMAAVYEATHRNGMRAAVKVLHQEFSSNEEARHRFLQEGYVANKVSHPGAVRILDDDVAEDGSAFLVMELLEGSTVEDIAASSPERRVAPSEVLAIADGVLDLLAAAHEAGVVHRDLKPENIFVTRTGEVKVLDFGLARLEDAGRMTRTGTGMGTPAFLPPEQANGQWDRVDERTDLWALGATLFTLATGRLVHDEKSLNRLLVAVMTQPAPPLRLVMPEASDAFARVIDGALAFEPSDRFESARAMQLAARAALQELPASDLSAMAARAVASSSASRTLLGSTFTRRQRPSRRLQKVVLGALGAIALGLVVLWAASPRPEPLSPGEGAPAESPPPAPSDGEEPPDPHPDPHRAQPDEADRPLESDSPEPVGAPTGRRPAPPPRPKDKPAPLPAPAPRPDPFGEFR